MTSFYRVSVLVLSVFAFWSILMVGYAFDDTIEFSPSNVHIPIKEEIVLDPIAKARALQDFESRIITNKSVVIENTPKPIIRNIPIEEPIVNNEINEEGAQLKEIEEDKTVELEQEEVVAPLPEINKSEKTSAFILSVPFTSQAPEGNWGEPWQEACEEASLIMTAHYFNKSISIPVNTAIDDIFTLVEYQTNSGLNYHDSDMYQTAVMGESVHGLVTEIIENPTIEDITSNLLAGNPVIAPYAGRLLKNPNFSPPGPRYHVHVIVGFDDATEEFITHDPGTRFGKNYRYSYTTIMNAMHDWTGSAITIEEGAKRILVVKGVLDAYKTN